MHHLARSELAVEIRDFLLVRTSRNGFELLRDADRFLPVLFLLVDLEQEFERALGMRRTFELEEQLFGAVQEPGLQIILRKLVKRDALFFLAEIGPLDEVLMHANRAL